MNPIELNLFASRVSAICDEMGIVLQRAAFSPNIKDRLDFSCALFSPDGELLAQAAHIPVHLGSMAYAMANIVSQQDWQAQDMLIVNDPFLGGTHLPDVTLIAPVFLPTGDLKNTDATQTLVGFVANRAHHANIGCERPGSMPVSSSLEEEGIIIPPILLYRQGRIQHEALQLLRPILVGGEMHSDQHINEDAILSGDFAAQVGANQVGVTRLLSLVKSMGETGFKQGVKALNDYGERLSTTALSRLPSGDYNFEDVLDDDGQGNHGIPLRLTMHIDSKADDKGSGHSSGYSSASVLLDLTACADQVQGNLNCPVSVAAAAAFYAFRCLMPAHTPACAGTFRPIQLKTRPGSIVNAKRPAAVAAGNVETSMRLVDLVFGALAQALPEEIPAASQGTMNNIAMGYAPDLELSRAVNATRWDYYETLAGGMGASARGSGASAMHSHMTNTLNTPIESLERHYPLRLRQYRIRSNSGGGGLHHGGCGIEREYEFLADAEFTLLTERRSYQPWGLAGGSEGAAGENRLNGVLLPAKCCLKVSAGDRLLLSTPGGGGWGLEQA